MSSASKRHGAQCYSQPGEPSELPQPCRQRSSELVAVESPAAPTHTHTQPTPHSVTRPTANHSTTTLIIIIIIMALYTHVSFNPTKWDIYDTATRVPNIDKP